MHAHASTTTDGTTGSDTTDGTLYADGVLSTVCWSTVLLLVVMVCYSVCSLMLLMILRMLVGLLLVLVMLLLIVVMLLLSVLCWCILLHAGLCLAHLSIQSSWYSSDHLHVHGWVSWYYGLPHAVGGLSDPDDDVLLICPRHHQDGKCISTTRPDITPMLSVPNIREMERSDGEVSWSSR